MPRERSAAIAPVVARLRLDAQGRLTLSLTDIVLSLVHVQANRLLRSAHRCQEMVLHEFLVRLYRAQLERGKAEGRS